MCMIHIRDQILTATTVRCPQSPKLQQSFDKRQLLLLTFVGISLVIISEWLPLSHRLLLVLLNRVLNDGSANWPKVRSSNHP